MHHKKESRAQGLVDFNGVKKKAKKNDSKLRKVLDQNYEF